METNTNDGYMKIGEASAYLNISQSTMNEWMARRIVPFFKISRAVRFRKSDLDAVLDSRFRVGVKVK
jgi:excisionase family DNA binding protein